MPSVDLRLDQARTDHLHTLVDDVGIVQHAYGVIPNWSTGYCVDDVARLALVALELERRDGDARWTSILHRALAFLHSAADGNGMGMRNFLSYERRWLDDQHVGDHVGRSIWALGEILSTASWFSRPRSKSRSNLGNSSSRVATITFPHTSCGMSCSLQNSTIEAAPARAKRAL